MRKVVSFKDAYIFLIIVYLVTLPLNAMSLGSFGSASKALAVLPVLVALFSRNSFKLQAPEKMQLVFTMFATFSLVWTVSVENSIVRVISYVLLFALLFSATMFQYTEDEVRKIKYSLVWASRITAVLVLSFGQLSAGRLVLRGIITEDPNYLCAYFAFGTVYCLNKIIVNKKFFQKLFAIAELAVYLYLVFATGSRGGLLALMAAIGAYIVVSSGEKSKHILAKIVSLALLVVLVSIILSNLPTVLRERFTIESVENSGGSGREDLWRYALDMYGRSDWFKHIFGFGTATARYSLGFHGYNRVNVIHNMFIETLVELGIVGLVLYSLAVFAFALKSFTFKDKFAFAVMACMIVMSLSTSICVFKPYFNIMLFIIVCENSEIPKWEYNKRKSVYGGGNNSF